jgi:hypothetical protein
MLILPMPFGAFQPPMPARGEKKLNLIRTINPEFKNLAHTWGWKTITVHEKDISVTIKCVPQKDPVLGLRWSKSSEQHRQDRHPRGSFGYAQDRLFDSAPSSAVCRDKSVRRSAQDDDFVGVLKKNIPNKVALTPQRPQSGPPQPFCGARHTTV